MSKPRKDLQTLFENIMHESWESLSDEKKAAIPDYTKHVYFQAPKKISYPAIVYERSTGRTNFANDQAYIFNKRYSVCLISNDPDSDILDRIAKLPLCIYERHQVVDNLHHDYFVIYY